MPTDMILYTEDDQDEAYLFTIRMQRYGYNVDVAGNVSDAVAAFDPQIHAVVVTDWNLPDGTAPEVIRGVKAKKTDVLTVIMSGCFKDEFLEEAEELDVTQCITKTVQSDYLEELATLLASVMPSGNMSEE